MSGSGDATGGGDRKARTPGGGDNRFGIPGLTDFEEVRIGSSSTVHRARDLRHARIVAVKILNVPRLDPKTRLAFERELTAMGVLSAHPHIVDLYGSGTTAQQQPYILMPFYRRGNYAARVDQDGPLDWRELVDFGVKVGSALATAHQRGFVHRDIKPANVFQGEFEHQPVLADFGISSFTLPSLDGTPTVEVSATPLYAAPEVLEGERPSVASDLYSLGATLFALGDGQAAYADRSMEIVVHRVTSTREAPRPRASMPAELADLLTELMAPDPERRPESARAVAGRLVEIQKDHGLDPTAIVTNRATAEEAARPSDLTVIELEAPTDDTSSTLAVPTSTRVVSAVERPTEPGFEPPRPPPGPRDAPVRPRFLAAVGLAIAAVVVAVGYALLSGGDHPSADDQAGLASSNSATPDANIDDPAGAEVDPSQSTGNDGDAAGDTTDDQETDDLALLWATVGTSIGWVAHETGDITVVEPVATADRNGPVLATGSTDGTLRLWDVEQQGQLFETTAAVEIADLSWDPASSVMVVARAGGTVEKVELDMAADPVEIRSGLLLTTGRAHESGVDMVAWSPSGDRLATGGADGTVRLWAANGRLLTDLIGDHRSGIEDAAWSPDGRWLATSGGGGRVIIWNTVDYREATAIDGPDARRVRSVSWSSDGAGLVTVDETGAVEHWSVSVDGDDVLLDRITGLNVGGGLNDAALAPLPVAALVATAHEDGTVRIVNIASGSVVVELSDDTEREAVSVTWSDDGTALAVARLPGVVDWWRIES